LKFDSYEIWITLHTIQIVTDFRVEYTRVNIHNGQYYNSYYYKGIVEYNKDKYI